MSPEDQHRYTSTHFTCRQFNGDYRSLPASAVNNNYCDCDDGSDEPGTAACAGRPAAVFYCPNTGSKPQRWPTSRVNDGVCDCCDGTDEYDGRIECENTCAEQGAAERAELDVRRKAVVSGLKKKNEYVVQGQQRHQEALRDLDVVREQLKAARHELNALASDKARVDRLEELEQKESELDDGVENIEHEHEHDDGSVESVESEEGSNQVEKEERDQSSDNNDTLDRIDDEEAERIRDQYNKAQNKVKDLERKEKNLNEVVNKDYGSDKRFAALDRKCFSIDTNDYVYEMCPFGKASQKPKRGANVNLGNFESFSDNHTRMNFKGGSSCWKGPKRSLGVSLECGETEKVLQILEPSMCVYEMRFATPAACTVDMLHTIDAQLALYVEK